MRKLLNKLSIASFFIYSLVLLVSSYNIYIVNNNVEFWGRLTTISFLIFDVVLLFDLGLKIRIEQSIKKLLYCWIVYCGITAITELINNGYVRDVNLLIFVAVVCLLVKKYDEKTYDGLIYIAIAFLAAHCCVSLYNAYLGKGIDLNYSTNGIFSSIISFRLHGTQWEANPMGGVAAACAISGLAYSKWYLFVLGVSTLFFTQSKTALFAMVLTTFITYYSKIKINKKIKYAAISFTFLVLGTIIYAQILDTYNTFSGRTFEWAFFYKLWLSSLKTMTIGISNTGLGKYNYVENQFLQSLFKNGILGLITFVSLMICLGKSTYDNYKSGEKLGFYLFILILCRCLMESHFASLNPKDTYFLILIISIRKTKHNKRRKLLKNEVE